MNKWFGKTGGIAFVSWCVNNSSGREFFLMPMYYISHTILQMLHQTSKPSSSLNRDRFVDLLFYLK